MRKKQQPQAIKTILGRLFEQKMWAHKMHQYALHTRWGEIVGKKIAQNATPSVWRGNTLVVEAADHSWLTELRLMEREIIGKIKKAYPSLKLDKIFWKLKC